MQQASYVPSGFGTNDVQIMAGSFDDFTFDDVIQVLGLSRQCLRLLVRRGEAAVSEVLLKAGQVLDARMPASSDPAQVFQALSGSAVRGSGFSFAVYHTEPTGPFPVPRGRLSDLCEQVRSASQGAIARASDALRPGDATAPTLRIGAPVPQAHAAAHFATATETTLGRLVAADLQPVLRQELNAVAAQVREQAQALHTLDGRVQALPQLVAAEVRLALAQQARARPAAEPAPAPAPAPAAAAPAAFPWGPLIILAAGMAVLFGVVVAVAVTVLR